MTSSLPTKAKSTKKRNILKEVQRWWPLALLLLVASVISSAETVWDFSRNAFDAMMNDNGSLTSESMMVDEGALVEKKVVTQPAPAEKGNAEPSLAQVGAETIASEPSAADRYSIAPPQQQSSTLHALPIERASEAEVFQLRRTDDPPFPEPRSTSQAGVLGQGEYVRPCGERGIPC